MPTILRIEGYRFYFQSHEPNELPHVHIDKAGATMKVWLEDLRGREEPRLPKQGTECYSG